MAHSREQVADSLHTCDLTWVGVAGAEVTFRVTEETTHVVCAWLALFVSVGITLAPLTLNTWRTDWGPVLCSR